MKRVRWQFMGLLPILACAAAPAAVPATAAVEVRTAPQDSLIPAGFGSLRQDDVTLSIRSGSLLVKVTPLAESVIRLLAPDTYNRLHSLVESRRPELPGGVSDPPELFLVSFFSYQQNTAFQPEDVQVLHQGRLLRPLGMVPITTGWGKQLLQQQESQSAIYAFEAPINFDLPFSLTYGEHTNEGWRSVISRMQAERTKVLSRAQN